MTPPQPLYVQPPPALSAPLSPGGAASPHGSALSPELKSARGSAFELVGELRTTARPASVGRKGAGGPEPDVYPTVHRTAVQIAGQVPTPKCQVPRCCC